MTKPRNRYEVMARDAAARLDKVRADGGQLTFLPDEDGSAMQLVEPRAPGRPKGAKGKVSSQMRDWLAAQGYQLPEDVIAQMAGLASREDAILTAMQNAERVLAWAFDGATERVGGVDRAARPTGAQRLSLFTDLYTIQLRAADALLPYGAPKATPDEGGAPAVQIVVPYGPERGQGEARDVTPRPVRIAGRMVPADVAHENQQKQEVSDSDAGQSDGESRTE